MRSLLAVFVLVCASGLAVIDQLHAQTRPPGPGAPGGPSAPPAPPALPVTLQLQVFSNVTHAQGTHIFLVTAAAVPAAGQTVATGWTIEVTGWWKIPKNQCANVGEFQRPGIFAYAMANAGRTWWGNAEPQLCVNLQAAFDYKFDS